MCHMWCFGAGYVYSQAGIIESAVCLLAYYIVFRDYGITYFDLPGFGGRANHSFALRSGRYLILKKKNKYLSFDGGKLLFDSFAWRVFGWLGLQEWFWKSSYLLKGFNRVVF